MSSQSPHRDRRDDYEYVRPGVNRSTTFEGPTQLHRDISPIPIGRISRVPSDNLAVRSQRSQLRATGRIATGNELLNEQSEDSILTSSPDRSFDERSASPATSYG
ncbi:MAG: hypothetical protein Q9190_006610, partial [Brigantiaea leucoxantha]